MLESLGAIPGRRCVSHAHALVATCGACRAIATGYVFSPHERNKTGRGCLVSLYARRSFSLLQRIDQSTLVHPCCRWCSGYVRRRRKIDSSAEQKWTDDVDTVHKIRAPRVPVRAVLLATRNLINDRFPHNMFPQRAENGSVGQTHPFTEWKGAGGQFGLEADWLYADQEEGGEGGGKDRLRGESCMTEEKRREVQEILSKRGLPRGKQKVNSPWAEDTHIIQYI